MTISPASSLAGSDSPRSGKRVVLTTIGSLGDLHPHLALALGLKARGHEVVVATGECYRVKVESPGLGFRPLRPNSDFVTDPTRMKRIMDFRWGTIRVLREVVLPAIRQSYDDTLAVANEGVDLLVAHPITFATRLVAEQRSIPWAYTAISPMVLASAYDPPSLPIVPDLAECLRILGPRFWGPLRRSLIKATRPWGEPILRLRAEIGLPPSPDNPLVEGFAPALVLTLFSRLIADTQPDWPPQTLHTGFPFDDRDGNRGMPPTLQRYLDAGPPPIVFTLGVTATMVAGSFFEQSVAAARLLGRRAVLITGKTSSLEGVALPDGVVAFDYVPFSEVFPRACAIVHAGGIGTSGLAMKARRPMLVVPHAHDQPDNAARLARLGVARTLSPRRYHSARVAAELRRLIEEPSYSRKASEIGQQVEREDGVQVACDALERLL